MRVARGAGARPEDFDMTRPHPWTSRRSTTSEPFTCIHCGILRSNRIAGGDDTEALDALAHRVVELTRDAVHGRIGP